MANVSLSSVPVGCTIDSCMDIVSMVEVCIVMEISSLYWRSYVYCFQSHLRGCYNYLNYVHTYDPILSSNSRQERQLYVCVNYLIYVLCTLYAIWYCYSPYVPHRSTFKYLFLCSE